MSRGRGQADAGSGIRRSECTRYLGAGSKGEAPYKTREWDQKEVIYSYYLYPCKRTSGSVGKVRDGDTKGRGFESVGGLSIFLCLETHNKRLTTRFARGLCT